MPDFLNWMNTNLHMPLSGSVSQRIAPVYEMAGYRGNPRLEERVLTDVAGYGSQLGTIADALIDIADGKKTSPNLTKLREVSERIAAHKTLYEEDLKAQAREALERLRKADPKGFSDVMKEQSPKA